MRILLLCEEDPESWTSWSGITKSIVDELRARGHVVATADVDLYGVPRLVAGVSTFAPNRQRWGARFHLGAVPFGLRSRRAAASVARHRQALDLVVQIGATFRIPAAARIPYFLCCDSNIRVAQLGAATGFSNGSVLSREELERVAEREAGVYRGAAAVFPLSEQLRQSFIRDFQIAPDRVRTIYAGPNFRRGWTPAPRAGRRADQPPTVLFVGLQFHRKGGDVLVESFRRVRSQIPAAQLLLAGVRAGQVEEPGITCLGELDKNTPEGSAALARAYESADVFALPSRFEPFGIAFVEAMHFGLPCIGPRAWAVPEIIEDGRTGYTVPIDDAATLADRLVRLLSDPALARTMGDAARARAERLFSWPAVISRMTEVMSAAVQRRPAVAAAHAS